MKKTIIFLMIAIVALISLRCSTEQDDVSTSASQQYEDLRSAAPEIYGYLECQGFDLAGAKLYDEYVVVEGVAIRRDLISKNIEAAEQSPTNGRTDQYVVSLTPTGVVDFSNVTNIKYYIHSSIANLTGDWEGAIHDALDDWENISNCRVSFVETTSISSADIRFFNDAATGVSTSYMPVCARNIPGDSHMAAYPSNGEPGSWVSINNHWNTSSQGNRETIIRHEVGHTLGLRHDNSSSEGAVTSCGVNIGLSVKLTGTPTVESSSVMDNSVFTSTTVRNFTSNDKKAATFLYPEGQSAVVINTLTQYYKTSSSKDIKFTMTSPSVRMYRYHVERLPPWSSTPVQTSEYVTTSNTFWMYNVPHGTWRFRINGLNYGEDVTTPGIMKTVTVQ